MAINKSQINYKKRGADARLRKTEDGDIYVTDNGNYILDVYDQAFTDPAEWQDWLQKIPGIVEQGFFSWDRGYRDRSK